MPIPGAYDQTHQAKQLSSTYDATSPQKLGNLVYKSASATLLPHEQIVIADTSGITLTLPEATQIAGRIFVITNTSSGDVTVEDTGATTGWATTTIATTETFVFVSTGVGWARIKGADAT